MPTARVGVGVGSNGGPGHGAVVVVPGAGAAVLLLRVVALAALVHPQQHRAQALGREPAALQVTGSTACQRRLALLATEPKEHGESEEERRLQQGLGEVGSCLGGERLLNALVLHGGGPAEAAATDGDLRPRRRGGAVWVVVAPG